MIALSKTHPPCLPKIPQPRLGTTIVVMVFKDGVMFGSDTRTSAGSFVSSRFTNKIIQVTERIFCCVSGSAADSQAICDIVKYQLSVYEMENGKPASVRVAANVFRDMCYKYRDDLESGLIIGGWEPYKGGQVFAIPIGGMITPLPIATGGSGSVFIAAYVDAMFRPDFTKEQAEKFLLTVVAGAIARDGSSGGCVRLMAVTKEAAERKLITPDKFPKHEFR